MWKDRPVLVTGGASFIGSHLVDALARHGARVRVVDDLSSGHLENIKRHVENGMALRFLLPHTVYVCDKSKNCRDSVRAAAGIK